MTAEGGKEALEMMQEAGAVSASGVRKSSALESISKLTESNKGQQA